MDAADAPGWLTPAEIAAAVARLLGREVCAVTEWTCRRVTGGGEAGPGVWRLTGIAVTGEGPASWSLILKGWMPYEDTAERSHAFGPQRELALYRSSVLATLPAGIRAPKCYGVTERPDGSTWFWLEAVREEDDGPWSLGRYATAARQLGRFNGAYLVGHPLPDDPAPHSGVLRQWVEAAGPAIAQLQQLDDHPLVRQTYPPHITVTFARAWTERRAAYALLDRLPRTFCHQDAHRRNLLVGRGTDGTEEVVAIDWEFAGVGAIGEDLAPLVFGSLIFHEVPAREVLELEAAVLTGYIHGLGDVGWAGDPALVWTGYRTAAVLRQGVGVVPLLLPLLLDERLQPGLEQIIGQPMKGILADVALAHERLVALAGKMRG